GRGDRGRRDRDRLVAPERRRGRAAVSEGRAQRDQDEDEAGGQRQPATESGIERHGIRLLFSRPVWARRAHGSGAGRDRNERRMRTLSSTSGGVERPMGP